MSDQQAEEPRPAEGSVSAEPPGEDPLKIVRHDVRGKLGVTYGAIQTALNQDLALQHDQRVELIEIALEGLQQLEPALERYLEVLSGSGEGSSGNDGHAS